MGFLEPFAFRRLRQDGAREMSDLFARREVRLPGKTFAPRPANLPGTGRGTMRSMVEGARAAQRVPRLNHLGFLPMILAGVLIGMTAPDWWPALSGRLAAPAAVSGPRAGAGDSESARFGTCFVGGGTNCVVDGDTFWYQGMKIRIADIDTPETHPARCAEEQRLGDAATDRLHALLNAGPFTLESIDRDTDRYGRQLRIVTRGGASLGGVLVSEGLAREWDGARRPWC